MKKILWNRDKLKELQISFPNTSRRTINNALNGRTNSDLVQRIRKRALDIGMKEEGEETVKIV